MAEADRLDQVLVQPQGTSDRARDLRDLKGVREPRSVVVAGWSDEHLRLVLEAPKGLGVDDPVAVTLERRPQPTVGLGALPPCGIGSRGERGELSLLPGPHPLRERLCDRATRVLVARF